VAAGLHIGAAVIIGVISAIPDLQEIGFLFFLLIGITQLVYVIPALVILHRRGQPKAVKGLIIGATITFLLNAACWGLLWGVFLR
jgi:hypothetical protein